MTATRPLIRLMFRGCLAKDARDRVRALVERLRSRTRRPVSIWVVPNPAVGDGTGARGATGFGMTRWYPGDPRVYICVAAGVVGVCREHGMTRDEGLATLEETVCHEWLHYEDLCAKRRMLNCGVVRGAAERMERRARALRRELLIGWRRP